MVVGFGGSITWAELVRPNLVKQRQDKTDGLAG